MNLESEGGPVFLTKWIKQTAAVNNLLSRRALLELFYTGL